MRIHSTNKMVDVFYCVQHIILYKSFIFNWLEVEKYVDKYMEYIEF